MGQQQYARPQGSMPQQLPSSYQMLPPESFAASGQLPASSSPAAPSTGFLSSGQPVNYSQLLNSAQQFALPYQGAYQQGLPAMQIPLGYYPPTSSYHLQQMAQSMWLTQQPQQQRPSGIPVANTGQAQRQNFPLSNQSLVSQHLPTRHPSLRVLSRYLKRTLHSLQGCSPRQSTPCSSCATLERVSKGNNQIVLHSWELCINFADEVSASGFCRM